MKVPKLKKYSDFIDFFKRQTSASMHGQYDKQYYLRYVGGEKYVSKFLANKGLALTKYTEKPLEVAKIRSGMKVLDVGCGRGEMVFLSARQGAEAYGIDFSPAAIEVATAMKQDHREEWAENAKFIRGNAVNMPFENGFFDVVFLLDVVEHVSDHELNLILLEIARVLKQGGKVIIHSTPNRLKSRYGYIFLMFYNFFFKRTPFVHPHVLRYKKALETDKEYARQLLLHINEQSIFSLKRSLRLAGFVDINAWYGNVFNPLKRLKLLGALFEKFSASVFHIFHDNLYVLAYKNKDIKP